MMIHRYVRKKKCVAHKSLVRCGSADSIFTCLPPLSQTLKGRVNEENDANYIAVSRQEVSVRSPPEWPLFFSSFMTEKNCLTLYPFMPMIDDDEALGGTPILRVFFHADMIRACSHDQQVNLLASMNTICILLLHIQTKYVHHAAGELGHSISHGLLFYLNEPRLSQVSRARAFRYSRSNIRKCLRNEKPGLSTYCTSLKKISTTILFLSAS